MNTVAFRPGNYYVSLSITGTYCELRCPFCKGKYLASMLDASNPEHLLKILNYYYRRGTRGFLISGGFNRDGHLIIKSLHLKIIREFKRNHDVIFSIHSGPVPNDLLELIWSSEIDFIDFEIPSSNEYLRVVKGLKSHTLNKYFEFMEKASSYSKEFIVPHIVLNSIASNVNDELRTIEVIADFKPRLLVTLVEIRSRNSNYIDIDRIIKVLRRARELFNEVSLGCMRPNEFKVKYDEVVIKERLVDRVVNPKVSIIDKLNLKVMSACCGISRSHFKLFPTLRK